MKPSEQHDAHVQLAHKTFRSVGFSLDAMQYKRTPKALSGLKRFNGVPDSYNHPFAWGYHPNAWMRDNWQRYY